MFCFVFQLARHIQGDTRLFWTLQFPLHRILHALTCFRNLHFDQSARQLGGGGGGGGDTFRSGVGKSSHQVIN